MITDKNKTYLIDKAKYNFTIERALRENEKIKIIRKRNNYKIYFYDSNFSYLYKAKKNNLTNILLLLEKQGLGKSNILSFFALISRKVNEYITNNELIINKIEEKSNVKTLHIKKYWDELKNNEIFYCIDINNAWWQSAYLLNIIPKTIYDNYENLPEYKSLRQIAFGLTKTEKEVTYIENNKSYTVSEIKNLEKLVFNNIRDKIYNLLYDIRKYLEKNNLKYLGITVDAIYVPESSYKDTYEFIKKQGWIFKVIVCRIIGNDTYMYGNQIKKRK